MTDLVFWLGVVIFGILAAAAILYWIKRAALGRDPRPQEGLSAEEVRQLHQRGLLSDEEFRRARRAALGLPGEPAAEQQDDSGEPPPAATGGDEAEEPRP